jgi:hypothetical protein
VRRAWQLFRALVERRIVEFIPAGERTGGGAKVRVAVDLPEDFSMDQTLSLYLIDTLALLDREAPDYALDVITLVESILENPEIILRKQLDRLKAEKVAEMKQAGIDYDRRMEELEKLEHPKPKREFIYETFNAFADKHPWVGQENIRPKSIAREMFEQFRSFADYVKDYELERSEGLLLRHLSSVHKVLDQTVPSSAKTDAVVDMETYLRMMIRQVDSSLLDEWEKMRDPSFARRETVEVRPPGAGEAPDITRDRRAFTAAVRTRVFAFLRGVATGDFEQGLAGLGSTENPGGEPWTPDRLRLLVEPYYREHTRICLDPEARNLRHTHIRVAEDRKTWRVDQVLVDPEGQNDWMAVFEVDVGGSRAAGEPMVRLRNFGAVGSGQ